MKFIILCPDHNTGGPFALLQLSKAINELGQESEIFFSNIGKIKPKTKKKNLIQKKIIVDNFIIKYKRKPRIHIPDIPYKICYNLHIDDVIIFTETMLDYSTTFYNMGFKNRVFLWLSWNNAPLADLTKFNNIINLLNSIHIFQSKHAETEARRLNFIGSLVSDYTIYDENQLNQNYNKTNDICFLEGKAPGTDELIQDLRNNFSIIPIKNMTQSQVIDTLKKSKFFIDFGSHPGKDRIPREAALHECIPLVHNIGAAKYYEDVTIPDYLKIDSFTLSNSTLLCKKINRIKSNINQTLNDIEPYIHKIKEEREIFYNEVRNLLSNIYNKSK